MPYFNTYILSLSEGPGDAITESDGVIHLFDVPDIRMISADVHPIQHDGYIFTYHNIDYRCQEAELKLIESLLDVLPIKAYYSYQLLIRRTKFDNRFEEYNYQQALNYLRYDMDRLGDKIPTDFAAWGFRLMDDGEERNMVTWEVGVHGEGWPKIILKHEPRTNKMLLGGMEQGASFVPYHPSNMVDVPVFHDEWVSLVHQLIKQEVNNSQQ